MRIHTLSLAALLILCPSVARAQVRLGISLGLPMAPQLEVVAPGIQVVAGFQDEVFVQGGWYWCRRDDGWYRSRHAQSHFDYVDSGRVPPGLRRMTPGHYRNYRHEEHQGHHGHDYRVEEQHHGHGNGHGNGHNGY